MGAEETTTTGSCLCGVAFVVIDKSSFRYTKGVPIAAPLHPAFTHTLRTLWFADRIRE